MDQTVGDVARSTGVSVRTLHHWDEVGLVSPSGRFGNGYRAYAAADVAQVRSVLGWRELGLTLEEIRGLLVKGATTAQLELHREALRAQADRLVAMTAAVDRALEARRMGIELDPAELVEVFGEDDPSRHAAETQERWGDTDAHAESHRRTSRYSKDDWLRMRSEQEDLEARMAAAMRDGVDGRALVEEHRRLISRWFYDCSPAMHLQLAQMYVDDERFTQHYDRRAPGLAQWVYEAIRAAHQGD